MWDVEVGGQVVGRLAGAGQPGLPGLPALQGLPGPEVPLYPRLQTPSCWPKHIWMSVFCQNKF